MTFDSVKRSVNIAVLPTDRSAPMETTGTTSNAIASSNGGPEPSTEMLRRQAALIELSYEPIFVWELDKGITDWNHGAENLYGFSKTEALGQVSHILLKTVPSVPLEQYLEILRTKGSWSGEQHHVTKSGETVVVESRQRLVESNGVRLVLESNRDITARNHAEEMSDRYRLLWGNSSDIIWFVRPDGGFVDVNQAAVDAYGYTQLEFQSMKLSDLRHPSTLVEFQDQLDTARTQEMHFETVHVRKDGTAFPVEVRANGADYGGERLVMAIVRDISERKHAEQENKLLTERNREILESISDAFVAVDRDWRFTYVNTQAEDLLDRKSVDLIDESLWESYPGLIGSEFEHAFRQAAEDGLASTLTAFYPDHDRWYEAHVYPAANGITVYFRNVTESKVAEQALRDSELRLAQQARIFDTTLSSITDFAYTFDKEGRFIYSNRALTDLLGIGLDDIKGKNFFDLHYPAELAERLQGQIQQVFTTGESVRDETPFTGADGELGFYEYIFNPVKTEDGTVEIVAGSTRDISERKRNEIELRESEERRQLAQEAGNVGIFDWDIVAGRTYWSERMWHFYGEEPCDINPDEEYWSSHLHDNDRDRVKFNIQRAVESESNDFRDEFRIVKKEGNVRWINAVAKILRDADGKALRMYGTNMDVTERKEAEERIKFSENQLRLVTNTVPALISYVDKEERFRFANQKFSEWVGKDPSTMVGMKVRDVFGAKVYNVLKPKIEEALSGREAIFETVLDYSKIGSRYVHASYVPDIGVDGTVHGYYGLTHDLTDLKRSEELLRTSEARMGLFMESITDYAIFSLDKLGRVESWNTGAVHIFGYAADEIIGQPCEILFTPEDVALHVPEKEMRTARRKGTASDDRWHLRKDGTRFFANGVMMPLYVGKDLSGYAKIATDLTEKQRRAEELQRAHDELEIRVKERTGELAQINAALLQEMKDREIAEGQRVELLGRLVTSQESERRRIARDLHDQLGQRLTALRLKIASLSEAAAGNDLFSSRVQRLQEIAERLDSEVSFLAWELRPTALDDLGLVDAVGAFVNEWSRHYEIAADFHSAKHSIDRLDHETETHLYRITQEALNNILKHAGAKQVTVLLEKRGEDVILIVEDDGKGFKQSEVSPGDSSKGLGLVGMRERAALVGGDVEIESAPGQGTTIYVRVPATP